MNWKVKRAKRTWLGRTLCRLLGDNAGGVMMEYVIIGVMVAAAAVVAITYIGKVIVKQAETTGKAGSGDITGAETAAKASRTLATEEAEKAETSRKNIAGQ